MELDIALTLRQQGQLFADPKRIRLLRQIGETGSISQGARQAGVSYKTAWDAVETMNRLAGQPLVERSVGGKGGGGAALSRLGERLLQLYELLEQTQQMALRALQDESVPLHSLLGAMARFSLQTSARNQLFGVVEAIEPRGLNDRVRLRLAGGTPIEAEITRGSCQRLALQPGKEVLALIKAPAVVLADNRADLDNRLAGEVISCSEQGERLELSLALSPQDRLYAQLESSALSELPAPGQPLTLGFAADQVLLAALS
ncbi:TOBE-like domain-containing protein [Marinobacterium arenosum]|uniref:TOBE-like domain-containing protein n=1 Tax=Marinobacterium arenosum TaxID=2862496 RepID=UPI001C94E8EB|nr:TOBE-like domain-containing protein [Marinobacterium arenosum]MBY4677796.1 TOBE domain-containing protein [Marinobacterium arenosum]